MKVRATRFGYFGKSRQRPGDVFEIQDETQFSKNWMEKVAEDVPVEKAEVKVDKREPVALSKVGKEKSTK